MHEMNSAHVVVIGGGPAGLEAAGQLASRGVQVTILEKDETPGGHLSNWHRLFPDRREGAEVLEYLKHVSGINGIILKTGAEVTSINRDQRKLTVVTHRSDEIKADAVVVATGFDLFACTKKEEYGYGIYDNVFTSAELELMFRAGGPVTSGQKAPSSVGIVHCVGSRDEKSGNLYCSKLCCITAVKQAIEIREHLPECKVFCFYMDMRMGGSGYEEIYREAQEKWGVSFIRGKVSEAGETLHGKIVVKVEDTLAGRPLKMELDMLVLMAGMEMSSSGALLADASGLKRGSNRFLLSEDNHYRTNRGNINGVFYAGTCTAPMNVTETISHARSAAVEVIDYLMNTE